MNTLKKMFSWYFSVNALPYWVILVVDSLICYLSGLIVFWLSYHGSLITFTNLDLISRTIFIYMVFNLIGFRVFRTYSGIVRYSSFVDLRRVFFAMLLSLSIAEIMHYTMYHWHFVGLDFVRLRGKQIFIMYILAMIGMTLFRILVKSFYDASLNNRNGIRTLVYGMNSGGIGVAKSIRDEKPHRFLLKGFISHDKSMNGRILMGEKVFVVNEELAGFIKELDIQAVLISPLQNDRFRNDTVLQDILLNSGVKIYMSPDTKIWTPDDDYSNVTLKEISVEDLLPRNQIQVDMEAIGSLLRERNIMITGSAGSIGSEMVRQIAVYKPAKLILIDQAETPQHDIRLMMRKNWADIKVETIVTSITNAERMDHIFAAYKPDYVFHAAAYKHVPMMEDNPSESISNNVCGTKIIADLSVKYGVKKFVMISTDKAVNPTNVMGCSKRICEIYCQSLNHTINQGKEKGTVTQFVTTRFGNVLGSNGSVIPLFEKQIKEGGPVTVTDPNIIRFFMLIPEACKLVLEAGTHGDGGEIFVFDMGKPVKIADLARRMIRLSGAKNVEIKYTGLRAGEKLYEEVLSTTENTLPSFHDKIRIAKVREYDFTEVQKDINELIAIAHTYDDMAIVAKMKTIVPEYISKNSIYSSLDASE
ncbi:MAG: nucleoside-diphosphate sugar epimerase/dehydratase [Prevotella bivia]|nr:nucleoside-diphosphate sugar epimerase/dehydratase [Prevotella bivia]